MRSRRQIAVRVELPPVIEEGMLLPDGAPKKPMLGSEEDIALEQEWMDAFLFEQAWSADLDEIIHRVVPRRLRGHPGSRLPIEALRGIESLARWTPGKDESPELERWRLFVSACVLYDPPETELMSFARYAGFAHVSFIDPGVPDQNEKQLVYMPLPPIEILTDPEEDRRIDL